MTRSTLAVLACLSLFGCRRQEGAPTAPQARSPGLDEIDTRTPLPLLPMMANHQKQNMRDHLLHGLSRGLEAAGRR